MRSIDFPLEYMYLPDKAPSILLYVFLSLNSAICLLKPRIGFKLVVANFTWTYGTNLGLGARQCREAALSSEILTSIVA